MKMNTMITLCTLRLLFCTNVSFLILEGAVDDLFKSQENETTTWKCVDSNSLSSMGLTTSVRKVATPHLT